MTYLRDSFSKALIDIGHDNPWVVVLTADLKTSTRCDGFAEKYPQRFIQCGIAEQNMMGVAAGLAKAQKIPIINSFAVFNPGRNWDQLRVSVCYANANVKIIGHHTGFSAGKDGATHQAFEDLAITRVLPNLRILQPNSSKQVMQAVEQAVNYFGPVYIRLGGKHDVEDSYEDLSFGKGQVLVRGNDLTLAVSGPLTKYCVQAQKELLARKISVEVVSFSSLKPFDKQTLIKSVKKTNLVLTVEDHQIDAGFGSLVTEVLSQTYPTKIIRHGIYQKFTESGSMQDLLKKYKLDKEGIKNKVLQVLK